MRDKRKDVLIGCKECENTEATEKIVKGSMTAMIKLALCTSML